MEVVVLILVIMSVIPLSLSNEASALIYTSLKIPKPLVLSNVKLLSATAALVVPSEVKILSLPALDTVLNPVPLEPELRDEPDEPLDPEVPDEPLEPEVPDEPELPDEPEEPDEPEVPYFFTLSHLFHPIRQWTHYASDFNFSTQCQ